MAVSQHAGEPNSTLSPVFAGLRMGLHGLFAVLVIVVVVREVARPSGHPGLTIGTAVMLAATYVAGVLVARSSRSLGVGARVWLAVLTLEWAALLWLSPDAAYVAFPLFFLHLHVLGAGAGSGAVAATTGIAIYGIAAHGHWSVGGVVGPLVGAGVAVLIGLGYRALAREAQQREAIMSELLETRGQLAAREHEAGVLAERARLAREIHDTVGQGLSSIQMLLHAAERVDADRPGTEHIRLARETAATNLADTRRFIRELTPPDLDNQGLGGALRRLARQHWSAQGLDVSVQVSDEVALPMHLQTALLRIAQGAIANVIQHARAAHAAIQLVVGDGELRFTITDDGVGFDAAAALAEGAGGGSNSFGLHATRERVEQLGGELTVDSERGRGVTLTVELEWEEP